MMMRVSPLWDILPALLCGRCVLCSDHFAIVYPPTRTSKALHKNYCFCSHAQRWTGNREKARYARGQHKAKVTATSAMSCGSSENVTAEIAPCNFMHQDKTLPTDEEFSKSMKRRNGTYRKQPLLSPPYPLTLHEHLRRTPFAAAPLATPFLAHAHAPSSP